MSRFFSKRNAGVAPYIPGEQPQDMKYVKLNTNESPFPPSERVVAAAAEAAATCNLYSDPESKALTAKMAEVFGVRPEQILMTNGSDELLNFAFMAFADESAPLVFPDISYGFYSVIAKLNRIPFRTIPLTEDFRINIGDYLGVGGTIVLANPNAPTGIALSLAEIERILQANPDNIVLVDEAYVDFGADSAVCLIDRYENLLVVGTFSKSRSLAGGRLGYGIANEKLIADLNTLKNAANPYTVNRMTSAAGIALLEENDICMANCRTIAETREWTAEKLSKLGFTCLPSKSNFLFARSERIGGEALYLELKKRGVLVRHFTQERICEYNRITVGTRAQMQVLLDTIQTIYKEKNL